jgi:hypothetical protein
MVCVGKYLFHAFSIQNGLKHGEYFIYVFLSVSVSFNWSLFHRYSDLEATLTELEVYYKQCEFKSEATIQQQTKLIEYLQKRIEDGDKKKKVCITYDTVFLQNLFWPCLLIHDLNPV